MHVLSFEIGLAQSISKSYNIFHQTLSFFLEKIRRNGNRMKSGNTRAHFFYIFLILISINKKHARSTIKINHRIKLKILCCLIFVCGLCSISFGIKKKAESKSNCTISCVFVFIFGWLTTTVCHDFKYTKYVMFLKTQWNGNQ